VPAQRELLRYTKKQEDSWVLIGIAILYDLKLLNP